MIKKTDIVIGSQYLKDSENKAPLYRKFGASILNDLTNGKLNIEDTRSRGFRAFAHALGEDDKLSNPYCEGDGVKKIVSAIVARAL